MLKLFPRLITLIITVAAHLTAYYQFQLEIVNLPLPSKWVNQFYFLLISSLLSGLILPFCRYKLLRWVLLLFRVTVFWIMGLPFGSYLGIELTLISALIVEGVIYLPKHWESVSFAVGVWLFVLIAQRPILAWEIAMPVPPKHDLLSLSIYSGLIIILAFFLRLQSENQLTYEELNRSLHNASLKLVKANLELQDYAVMAKQQAEMNERRRLTREIHDTLAYTLTNLVMMLEAALDLTPGDCGVLQKHLQLTRDQALKGLADVRRALQALRPLEMAKVTGLPAITNLVKTFTNATQIKVSLNLGDAPLTLGKEADLTAYRLVQEGITNAIRHGLATSIEISFSSQNGGVNIYIKDNGFGAVKLNKGYGLTGMSERIEQLGGRLEIFTKLGAGFLLSAWIPWDKEVIKN
jgi:signal transduction histidine kinase